jgi:hypothetical protein
MSSNELAELKALLDYWIKHNREHGEEFKEWADRAKGLGENEIAGDLSQAVQEIDKTNDVLTKALNKLEKKEG